MANPQTENGFTKIANELLDALCKIRIPGEARQILDVILRKTYGYNKKEDSISLGMFKEMTGIPRPTCVRGIKKLIDLNIISVNKEKYISKYSVNKNYESWKVLSKKITVKKGKSVDKNDNKVLTKMITLIDNNDNKSVDNNDTHKRKKEIFKENKDRGISFIDYLPEELNDEKFIEAFREWIEYRKSIKKKLNEFTIKKQLNFLHRQSNPVECIEQSIRNGWAGLFEIKTNGKAKLIESDLLDLSNG